MANIAEGMKDLLVTAGVGTEAAASGWGIWIGKFPAKDTAVVVMHTGGITPNPRYLLDRPSMQVLVRGAPNRYTAAWDKAQAVKDALLGLPSQDIDSDRWVAINMIGDITNLGFDDNNRVTFSLNFSLIIEPATGTNRVAL